MLWLWMDYRPTLQGLQRPESLRTIEILERERSEL